MMNQKYTLGTEEIPMQIRHGKYRGDRGIDRTKRHVHPNSIQNLKQNKAINICSTDVIESQENSQNCMEPTSENKTVGISGKWLAIGFAAGIICILLLLWWTNRNNHYSANLQDTVQG